MDDAISSFNSNTVKPHHSDTIPRPPALKPKPFLFSSLPTNSLAQNSTEELTAVNIIEDIAALNKLCHSLTDQGRLDEALRCKCHTEKLIDIRKVKEIKGLAAEREDYNTAIQYRNIVSQLEKELVRLTEAEEWVKPQTEPTVTLSSLETKVKNELGEEAVIEFNDRFKIGNLQTSSDIETALSIISAAQHYVYLLHIIPPQQYLFVQQSHMLLQQIERDIKEGIDIFQKIGKHQRLSRESNVVVYKKCLVEVYMIAARLEKSLKYIQNVGSLMILLNSIKLLWSDLSTYLENDPVKPSVRLGENLCSICLLSGTSINLGSNHYHAPCINYWTHKVKTELPLFKAEFQVIQL